MIEAAVSIRPAHPALVEFATGRRWTYAEMADLADRVACMLEARGVGRGDRVATLLPNRAEHVVLLFACGRLGAALVPFNWRLTPAELGPIITDAAPALIVVGAAHREALASTLEPDGQGIEVLDLDAPESGAEPGAVFDALPEPPDDFDPPPPDPESTALVLYTSGSTGRPKGAAISHRQLRANAVSTCTGWGLGPDDVLPITTPLFHTVGWNVFATPTWPIGATIVLLRGFDPDECLRMLREERCTMAFAVPTQLHLLTGSDTWQDGLPHLRRFISGGAPCPPALATAVREAGYPLQEAYGLTECGPNCFMQTPEESEAEPGWVGQPLPTLDVRLVTAEGRVVEGAGVGELQLRGPQLFNGYIGDPERTAEAFDGGWLRTGDVAERSAAGRYRICGRIREMFISGGENVYPAEVESVLLDHPDVAEVAVVAVPDEKWGEVGRAWVVRTSGASADAEDIRMFARSRLAGYKVPRSVRWLPELPLLGSGKIDRSALAEMGASDGA